MDDEDQIPEITESSCRICLKDCTNSDQDSNEYARHYNSCTGYSIHDEDIPKKICEPCASSLNLFWDFRTRCTRTENILVTKSKEIKLESDCDAIVVKLEPDNVYVEAIAKHNNKDRKKRKKKRKANQRNPQICEICGATVSCKGTLEKHYESHFIDPNGPRLYCDICVTANPDKPCDKFGYLTRKRLVNHMQRKHIRAKRSFTCKQCDKIFNSKSSLQFHHYYQHVDPQTYKFECTVCKKRFFRRGCLTDHQQTHSGEKCFTCNFCGSKFTSVRHRTQHITNVHKNSVETCTFCQKTFKSRKYLQQHLKSHELSYCCPLCPEKTFSLSTTLKSHMHSTHPDFPLPPPGTILKNFDWSKMLTRKDGMVN